MANLKILYPLFPIQCYKFNKQTSSLYKTWEIEKAYGSEFKGVQAFDFNHDGLKEILVTGFKQIMIYNEINDKIIVIDSVNCKYSGKLAIVGTEDESLICIPCQEKITSKQDTKKALEELRQKLDTSED